MSFRITKNILSSGMDSDRELSQVRPEFFTDAQNIDVTRSGNFLGVTNIKGTSHLKTILGGVNMTVLGAFETSYKINNITNIPCLTIFTYHNNLFKIWCYDVESNTLYELYEKQVPADYLTNDRLVSAYRYGEHDIDILYFTDFYHELRQLRCVIPTVYTPNFLNDYDLSLQRKGAVGKITVTAIEEGGSLLAGSYQYCYRMVDPLTKRVTRWSSLTVPIYVSSVVQDFGGIYVNYSEVGLYTNRRVKLNILPTEAELNNFTHFQVAVIENIYPTPPTVASLLPITPVSELNNFIHGTNYKVDTILIEDIVIDQAAIETAKTITVNNNRLIAGNIRYRRMDFDNGEPTVTTGSVVKYSYKIPGIEGTTPFLTTGYFRDEVYRFGIVYEDADGNKSEPYPLDMSNVVHNTIQSGLTDMKFPKRHFNSGQYSLLSNVDSYKRAIGLSLTIVNHPKWAKAFEIVRVKRIPRILFQTPVIPMMRIKGTGALRSYPSSFSTYHGTQGVAISQPNAQPMTSAEVYVPKNLLFPERRRMNVRAADQTISGWKYVKGESLYELDSFYNMAMIFTPDRYGVAFVYTGNESLEVIDRALLRVSVTSYSTTSYAFGDYRDTSLQATFYATKSDQYAVAEGYNLFSGLGSNKITDYKLFETGSPGSALAGLKVFQYSDLSTKGSNEPNYEPNVYNCAVVTLANSINDNGIMNFPVGNRQAYIPGGTIVSTQPSLKYSSSFNNNFIVSYPGFVNNVSCVQAVGIANVVNTSIGDNRYGDRFAEHEYISTGTRYVFSESEVQDYIKNGTNYPVSVIVFGGDCVVAESFYQVTDSAYVISNFPKQDAFTAFGKWGGGYNDQANNTYLNLPVPLKNVAQYLQLVIESPDNTQVMAEDRLKFAASSGQSIIWRVENEAILRSPLLNKYNINLSKQNDQKIYKSLPKVNVRNDVFKSRIIYSDLKIYNTLVAGFDVFRALNFVDLPEAYGALMSLNNVGDNLYAIQESGIVMLPVGEIQITAKEQVLTVGTPDVFGKLIVVDNSIGSKHPRSVVYTPTGLFFVDAVNKAIYKLSPRGLELINKFNNSFFREHLNADIPERLLIGVYDNVKKQYIVADSSNFWSQKYDEFIDNWSGGLTFGSTNQLQAAVTCNGKLYFIGNTDETAIYTMHTGDPNQIFGVPVTPFVKFVVNPQDYQWSKLFDVLYIASTDKLSHVDLEVKHSPDWGTQTVLNQPVDVNYKEGLYCIPTLRDTNNARLRGLNMIVKLYWGSALATVSAVYTKYRMSHRIPPL